MFKMLKIKMPLIFKILFLFITLNLISLDVKAEEPSLDSKLNSLLPKETYPEIKLDKTPVLKYDFSKKKNFIYDYWQRDINHSKGSGGSDALLNGEIVIKSNGDKSSLVVVKESKARIKLNSPSFRNSVPKEIKIPEHNITKMGEDSNPIDGYHKGILAGVMFNLPSKDLKVNESERKETDFELKISKSRMKVRIDYLIKLNRYVKIGDRVFAELLVDIKDMYALNGKRVSQSDYGYSGKGKGLFYFDIERRYLIFGLMVLRTDFNIKVGFVEVNPSVETHIRLNIKEDSY